MNKEDALLALKAGKAIRHKSFSVGEYIELFGADHNFYMDEDGTILNVQDFWYYRTSYHYDSGWSIVTI